MNVPDDPSDDDARQRAALERAVLEASGGWPVTLAGRLTADALIFAELERRDLDYVTDWDGAAWPLRRRRWRRRQGGYTLQLETLAPELLTMGRCLLMRALSAERGDVERRGQRALQLAPDLVRLALHSPAAAELDRGRAVTEINVANLEELDLQLTRLAEADLQAARQHYGRWRTLLEVHLSAVLATPAPTPNRGDPGVDEIERYLTRVSRISSRLGLGPPSGDVSALEPRQLDFADAAALAFIADRPAALSGELARAEPGGGWIEAVVHALRLGGLGDDLVSGARWVGETMPRGEPEALLERLWAGPSGRQLLQSWLGQRAADVVALGEGQAVGFIWQIVLARAGARGFTFIEGFVDKQRVFWGLFEE